MHTEMHDAQVYNVRLVSARKVVFTFDLNEPENYNMRDPEVVRRSMVLFLLEYPRVDTYAIEYVGDWLLLTVTGTISMHVVDTYL